MRKILVLTQEEYAAHMSDQCVKRGSADNSADLGCSTRIVDPKQSDLCHAGAVGAA